MPSFSRLVRFVASDGNTYQGDAILPSGTSDLAQTKRARVIQGDIFSDHRVTDEIKDVKTLLSPLGPEQIRTVRCLGLNYKAHADESGMPYPKYPVLFYKPATAVGGPFSTIPVSVQAQVHESVDYECELVAVIGKPCRGATREDALSYVLGYTVGNDVSHREWQLRRGGGQWGLGKGFDGWAPMGPGIVTAAALPKGHYGGLRLCTKLNGKTVQDGLTSDMIFDLEETISFLSQGVTLQPGDIIMTGTPPGVGQARKPPLFLKDGDMVEVSLEGVGTCSNKVIYEKSEAKSKL